MALHEPQSARGQSGGRNGGAKKEEYEEVQEIHDMDRLNERALGGGKRKEQSQEDVQEKDNEGETV